MISAHDYVTLQSTDAASREWLDRWGTNTHLVHALLSVLKTRDGTLRGYCDDTEAAFQTLARACGIDARAVDKNALVTLGILLETGLPAGLVIRPATGAQLLVVDPPFGMHLHHQAASNDIVPERVPDRTQKPLDSSQ